MNTQPDSQKTIFIRTDENKIVNEKYIRWIKKMDECLEICSKSNGCIGGKRGRDTHNVCKDITPSSFVKLMKYF
jgi:hypothetical protein